MTYTEGDRLRDEGIARVAAGTPPRWTEKAMKAGRIVAHKQEHLTSDDIWEMLARWGVPEPPNNKAMGKITRELRKEGLIELTDRTQKCRRDSRHSAPVTIHRIVGVERRDQCH